MKWFENLTLVLRSSVTTLQEKVENPERMLHQLILDMEEEVRRVRDNVAQAIADEIQLGKRVEKARADAEVWAGRNVGVRAVWPAGRQGRAGGGAERIVRPARRQGPRGRGAATPVRGEGTPGPVAA